jgi:hypothetical protein
MDTWPRAPLFTHFPLKKKFFANARPLSHYAIRVAAGEACVRLRSSRKP